MPGGDGGFRALCARHRRLRRIPQYAASARGLARAARRRGAAQRLAAPRRGRAAAPPRRQRTRAVHATPHPGARAARGQAGRAQQARRRPGRSPRCCTRTLRRNRRQPGAESPRSQWFTLYCAGLVAATPDQGSEGYAWMSMSDAPAPPAPPRAAPLPASFAGQSNPDPSWLRRRGRAAAPSLLVLLLYLCAGRALFWQAWQAPTTQSIGFYTDPQQFMWFLGWAHLATTHLHNP